MHGDDLKRNRPATVARVVASLATLVVAMAISLSGHAEDLPITLTYDMPTQPNALSAAEFDAIVGEARDDVEMELPQDVAERAKIDFLRTTCGLRGIRGLCASSIGQCGPPGVSSI